MATTTTARARVGAARAPRSLLFQEPNPMPIKLPVAAGAIRSAECRLP